MIKLPVMHKNRDPFCLVRFETWDTGRGVIDCAGSPVGQFVSCGLWNKRIIFTAGGQEVAHCTRQSIMGLRYVLGEDKHGDKKGYSLRFSRFRRRCWITTDGKGETPLVVSVAIKNLCMVVDGIDDRAMSAITVLIPVAAAAIILHDLCDLGTAC